MALEFDLLRATLTDMAHELRVLEESARRGVDITPRARSLSAMNAVVRTAGRTFAEDCPPLAPAYASALALACLMERRAWEIAGR